MPIKPKSHSERLQARKRPLYRRTYEEMTRRRDPVLAQVQRLRNCQQWRKVRAIQLSRQPLCADPYHRHVFPEPATEVDHIVPLRVAPELAYVMDNLQGLCDACHNIKSAFERKFYPKRKHI